MIESQKIIQRHVESLKDLKKNFKGMDKYINPVMGIGDWDDAICLDFTGRLLASSDGPYSKRLVLKSALIHAATDIVVKGGKPICALDCLIGVRKNVVEMAKSLKKQAENMKIPILGGNTLYEDEPARASITVLGKLVLKEPIRDRNARKGDRLYLLGEPLWGSQDERIKKAKNMFKTWFEIIQKIPVNAAKDVTKGGLVSTAYEIQEKSGRKIKLVEDLPYHATRNLDNFMLTISSSQEEKLRQICRKNECRLEKIGEVK